MRVAPGDEGLPIRRDHHLANSGERQDRSKVGSLPTEELKEAAARARSQGELFSLLGITWSTENKAKLRQRCAQERVVYPLCPAPEIGKPYIGHGRPILPDGYGKCSVVRSLDETTVRQLATFETLTSALASIDIGPRNKRCRIILRSRISALGLPIPASCRGKRPGVRGKPETVASLRRRMDRLSSPELRCDSCGLSEWQGQPLLLEVHHIDKNPKNNVPENVRLLCPNCHTQMHRQKDIDRMVAQRSRSDFPMGVAPGPGRFCLAVTL